MASPGLLTARSTAAGLNRRRARLVAALNASHLMAEAATALGVAGIRPPPLVIEVVSRLADAIRQETPPPMIPPPWDARPAMMTLRGRSPRQSGRCSGCSAAANGSRRPGLGLEGLV